jgi:hypothetical protein
MPSRKACGVDGIPAEILKHSPESFKENLRHLVNAVFASEFKVPKDALLAKVILLYKKGDPSLLGNYRPIALLTSTYQLMNLILAGRLQDLAERHGVFESSQYGFRWLHRVTDSVQKQQLLLKFAMAGDGKLVRIDLDYANAFNSAGHACLWAILEKFGVPDIDLLKNFYDLASMRLHVGVHETADVFMDTGTAQGSALSPLLFILFINALLRLFDNSELHHGVDRVPQFNHLAFADDLSLYLNSEANANKLLEKVLQFEHWSGLRLALSKSFITGVLHGKGAARRTSALARDPRGGSENPTRAHFSDLIMIEDDGTMVSWFADPILRPLNNSVVLAVCKIDPRASFSQEPLMLKIRIEFVSRAGLSGCPPGSSIMDIRSQSSRVHLLLVFWGSTEICAVIVLCRSRWFSKSRHSSSTFFGRKNSPRVTASAWYR